MESDDDYRARLNQTLSIRYRKKIHIPDGMPGVDLDYIGAKQCVFRHLVASVIPKSEATPPREPLVDWNIGLDEWRRRIAAMGNISTWT
jgi:hypothetical protein